MATFTATVTYPDAKQVDLRDTLCLALNYQTTIPNPAYVEGNGQPETIPNPETKAQFIQREANDFLRRWIKNNYERQKEIIAQQSIEKLDATI